MFGIEGLGIKTARPIRTALEQGDLEDAERLCKEAISKSPSDALIWENLGLVHMENLHLDDAIECFEKALKLRPELVSSKYSLFWCFFLRGELQKGWKQLFEYYLSALWSCYGFIPLMWKGESLKEKNVYILCDKFDVGDLVLWASAIPDVVKQGGICFVDVEKRLEPIFQRSFPGVVYTDGNISKEQVRQLIQNANMSAIVRCLYRGMYDFHIPLFILPFYFRQSLKDFPQKAYLIADPEKVNKWHGRFKELGEGLKVGISWRGGKEVGTIRKRSTTLEQWGSLFSISGICWVNLQYGNCNSVIQGIRDKFGVVIHDWPDSDPLKDLDDFTAKVKALDLVISIDNTTVHFSGALGIPTWVMLPNSPSYRWMLKFDDTPWYPNMRLFRQNSPGDWEGVFRRVSENLRLFMQTGQIPKIKLSYRFLKEDKSHEV